MKDVEVRLAVLRLVKEFGSENTRANPLEQANVLYEWVTEKYTDTSLPERKKSVRKTAENKS